MKMAPAPRRRYCGGTWREMISPASTARSDVHTSADAEPMNTERRLTLPDANDNVASCVLSPSSATNTAPNVVAKIFQSTGYARVLVRPHGPHDQNDLDRSLRSLMRST